MVLFWTLVVVQGCNMDFSLEFYLHRLGMDVGKQPHVNPIRCFGYALYPIESTADIMN